MKESQKWEVGQGRNDRVKQAGARSLLECEENMREGGGPMYDQPIFLSRLWGRSSRLWGRSRRKMNSRKKKGVERIDGRRESGSRKETGKLWMKEIAEEDQGSLHEAEGNG